ncbi:MAG: hypothetical protein Q7K39_03685 [Candidatus Magasanikbacteria bacterium]|nr:hypothetical protein [Candidatus Magasanikbacteria bacterium]
MVLDKPKVYSKDELRQQGLVIERVLRTGTKEELDKLKAMYRDSEVHPQVRALIRQVAAMENMAVLFSEQTVSLEPERKGVGMRPRKRK